MKRIGVFSGTFDPFHIAHLEVCLVSRAACELDAVVVLIEQNPLRKTNVTDYTHRLAMVDLALQEYPAIRIIESGMSNITTRGALKVLNQQFGRAEYHYIFGSDMLEHMAKWPEFDSMVKNFSFCTVLRSNKDESVTQKKLTDIKKSYPELRYKLLPAVWSPVSSSKIRHAIEKNGYSEHIHREVLKYILKNQIY